MKSKLTYFVTGPRGNNIIYEDYKIDHETNLSKESKKLIYSAIIKSIITYNSEVRQIREIAKCHRNVFLAAHCKKIKNGKDTRTSELDR